MAIKTKTYKKATGNYGKILGALVAVFVIALIIMSGPAQAFVLNINSDKTSVSKGESVVFTVSVDINSNENLPISKLVLELSGPEHVVCEFNVDGTIISGCKGISIQKMIVENSKQGYGYGTYNGYGYNFGYGYGYDGNLEYKITLFTTDYFNGVYFTLLKTYVESEVFSKSGNNLEIKALSSESSYGGSGWRICINSWECTEWSSCNNEKQTRTCTILPNCYLENKPSEIRDCTIELVSGLNNNSYDSLAGDINLNSEGDSDGNSEDTETNTTGGIMQNFLAGITGAVIGTSNQASILVMVIFIAIISGLIVGLIIMRGVRRARIRRKAAELERIRYIPPSQ